MAPSLSNWHAPGGANPSDYVRIARGVPGMIERLVVEAPPGHQLSVGDLTIAGEPFRFGGQVAECITVKLVGMANFLAAPVKNPAVTTKFRAAIDPYSPRTIDRAFPLSKPLPPGTVEAFHNEGTSPAAARKKTARSESERVRPITARHARSVNRFR